MLQTSNGPVMSTPNVDAVWLNPRGPGAYGASLAASVPTLRQQWTFAVVCGSMLAAFAVAMVLRNAAPPKLGLTPLLIGGQIMTAYLLCAQMIQLRRLNVGPQRDSALEELISAADGALYVSKGAGRNRVTVAPSAATVATPSAS